jgi:ribosomal protein S18 acetylase RimI-like enzyme
VPLFDPIDYVIRPLTSADESILWEMLYQALQTAEGATSRDIVRQPEYARYVEDWGRAGDTGFVALDKEKGELLGAVWFRIIPESTERSDQNEVTPELAFTVKPTQRKRGIGAALLTQLVKANPHSAIAIHAPTSNPAVRLYERFGFKIVNESQGIVTMRREV